MKPNMQHVVALAKAQFEEHEHPRGKDGKFAPKAGARVEIGNGNPGVVQGPGDTPDTTAVRFADGEVAQLPTDSLKPKDLQLEPFNELDWQAMNGAEDFEDGTPPHVADLPDFGPDGGLLVVDRHAIQIQMPGSEQFWLLEPVDADRPVMMSMAEEVLHQARTGVLDALWLRENGFTLIGDEYGDLGWAEDGHVSKASTATPQQVRAQAMVQVVAKAGMYDEAKHPRGHGGKFAPKAGGGDEPVKAVRRTPAEHKRHVAALKRRQGSKAKKLVVGQKYSIGRAGDIVVSQVKGTKVYGTVNGKPTVVYAGILHVD